MARGRTRSSGDGLGGAVFGLLLVVAIVVKFFWWFVAAAVAVGAFFAVRAIVRHIREQNAAAARESEELAYRADRQHRWARRGDSRGVFGPTGAELMRTVSPEPSRELPEDSDHEVPIAAVAYTTAELSHLVADKPAGWRWAAFASVLVQRRDAVQSRLLDCELGYANPNRMGVHSGIEVASFATDCMSELMRLVDQVEAFMLTPAFMGAFGMPTTNAPPMPRASCTSPAA